MQNTSESILDGASKGQYFSQLLLNWISGSIAIGADNPLPKLAPYAAGHLSMTGPPDWICITTATDICVFLARSYLVTADNPNEKFHHAVAAFACLVNTPAFHIVC